METSTAEQHVVVYKLQETASIETLSTNLKS